MKLGNTEKIMIIIYSLFRFSSMNQLIGSGICGVHIVSSNQFFECIPWVDVTYLEHECYKN